MPRPMPIAELKKLVDDELQKRIDARRQGYTPSPLADVNRAVREQLALWTAVTPPAPEDVEEARRVLARLEAIKE